MSYCRWSSDFFECAVYVYADVNGGWTTHVAGRKRKHTLPEHIKQMQRDIKWTEEGALERYQAAEQAEHEWFKTFPHTTSPTVTSNGSPGRPVIWLDDSEYESLNTIGPEAGKTFNHDTPGECAEFLITLKNKGFSVPQYAIDNLREEQKEMDNG